MSAAEPFQWQIAIPSDDGSLAQLEAAKDRLSQIAFSGGTSDTEGGIALYEALLISIMLSSSEPIIDFKHYMELTCLPLRSEDHHDERVKAWNRVCRFNYQGASLEPWIRSA
ncbi:MAG TPA: hypothetical protein VF272_01670 [Candidatus Saccharimonadia bacterium]